MRAEEFLRDKFDEHWKIGGSALNISAYAESKILIWMDEYKQLHQPTVSGCLSEEETKKFYQLMLKWEENNLIDYSRMRGADYMQRTLAKILDINYKPK